MIVGILSSVFLMTVRVLEQDWAGATFWFAIAGYFGTQLKKDRELDCPNGRCGHQAGVHSLNTTGEWRCELAGCTCGLRLVVQDVS